MNVQPITEDCRKIFSLRSHACFGISPFNSYFSGERLRAIAEWGKKEFAAMHFFVPDVPSAYTLEALGYDPEKAAWKARRQSQYLHNKIQGALRSVGFSDEKACQMVLNWEVLSTNARYVELYKHVKALFEYDQEFQDACISASRWVLEKRVPDTATLTRDVLCSAARYLLTEIPLFIDTPGIVGKESSMFCYHDCVSFLENLFHGRYAVRVSVGQGFLITKPSATLPVKEHLLIEEQLGVQHKDADFI